MDRFEHFRQTGKIVDAQKEAEYKTWQVGGEIGPNPNKGAGLGALEHQLYQHSRWLRTDGRFGERLVAQTKTFSHLHIEGVDFSKAILANVTFFHLSLSEASFKGAQLFNVTFDHCDLDKTEFAGAAGRYITFTGSNEGRADFGEGRTGIEDKGPDRNDFRLVGRAKAKYYSLET